MKCRAGHQIRSGTLSGFDQTYRIIAGRNPDEHAGVGIGQLFWRNPSVLERVPRLLQQQTLLRVKGHRFSRRDAEESCIEIGNTVDESGEFRIHLSDGIGVGIVVGIHIPPVRRHFANRVYSFVEQLPKALRIRRARETATEANHGDGLGETGCLHRRGGSRRGCIARLGQR